MLHINRELNGSKIDRVQIERSVASKEIAEEKRSTIGFIYEYYLPSKRIGIFSSRFRREELSIFFFDPREMYFRSVRFFLSLTFHACQKWIPKSLRSGGNKKLRAMIRNRPPLPLQTVPRHHVFSCLVVCLRPVTSRAGTQEICGPWNERLVSAGRRMPYARS